MIQNIPDMVVSEIILAKDRIQVNSAFFFMKKKCPQDLYIVPGMSRLPEKIAVIAYLSRFLFFILEFVSKFSTLL